MKLGVARIGLGDGREVLRGQIKFLFTVVTQPQERLSLRVGRVSCERGAKRGRRRGERSLLEFCQPKVQVYPWELRVELERSSIRRCGLWIFLLLGENHTQTGEGRSIIWVMVGHGFPGTGSLRQLPLLFESDRVGRSRRLSRRRDREERREQSHEDEFRFPMIHARPAVSRVADHGWIKPRLDRESKWVHSLGGGLLACPAEAESRPAMPSRP